jgi:O-antigen/teichoic acid export membrane protein
MSLLDPLKALGKNSLSISASRVVQGAAFLGLSVLIARMAGANALGMYALAMSLYSIAEFISTLGMDNYLIREFARERGRGAVFVSNSAFIGIVSSGLCLILLALAAVLLGYPRETRELVWLTGLILWPAFMNYVFETSLIAAHRSADLLAVTALRESVMLAGAALAFLSGLGLGGVLAAIALSRVVALYFFSLKTGIPFAVRRDWPFIKEFLRSIPVFFFIALASILFMELDIIILSKTMNTHVVGLYSVSKKMLRVQLIFIYGLGMAILPVLSGAFHASPLRMRAMYGPLLAKTVLSALGLWLGGVLAVPPLIRALYGEPFEGSAGIFLVVSCGLLPLSLSFLWSRFLIAAGRQDKDLIGIALGVVLLLGTGIVFSMTWGAKGMAASVACASLLMAVVHYVYFRRYVAGLSNPRRGMFQTAVIYLKKIYYGKDLGWAQRAFRLAVVRVLRPYLKTRYAGVMSYIRRQGAAPSGILEAGSGSVGMGVFYSGPFTGLDVNFWGPRLGGMARVKGDSRDMPFSRGQFDLAVSLDMLEHLRPSDRQRVIREMIRVSRRGIVIGFPSGRNARSAELQVRSAIDLELARLTPGSRAYKKTVARNRYLFEHLEAPLPEADEVVAMIDHELKAAGRQARIVRRGNERLGWWSLLMKANVRRGPVFFLLSLLVNILPAGWLSAPDPEKCYRTVIFVEMDP